MSKSNEYGYIPESPTQARGSNSGVFEVNDVTDLLLAQKWSGQFSKLDLIETVDMTGLSSYTFTTLGTYKMHKLVLNNYVPLAGGSMSALGMQLSSDGGSTFITSGYQYSYQYNGQALAGEGRTTTGGGFVIGPYINDEGFGGDCLELYGLVDSGYSFQSFHSMDYRGDNAYSGNAVTVFGNSVLKNTAQINAFKIYDSLGNLTSGTFSLYGYSEVA